MGKFFKFACFICLLMLLIPGGISARTKRAQTTRFNWKPVIDAIIEVESEGQADAVDKSGKSCGIMQITPILVADCNRILKLKKSRKRYTLKDRFSVSKSKEMFLLFQSFYNPTNSIELAIRTWNGGMHYTKRGTQKYYEKVMSKMK